MSATRLSTTGECSLPLSDTIRTPKGHRASSPGGRELVPGRSRNRRCFVQAKRALTKRTVLLSNKRRSIINKSLTRIARKKSPDNAAAQKDYIDRVFANISTTTSAQEAAASPDLIIEAIVENLKTKQDLFQRFDGIAPAHTIFASNTSSLSVRKIAELVSDERKKRFLALHYFNPVPAMRLVRRTLSFLPLFVGPRRADFHVLPRAIGAGRDRFYERNFS